MKHIIFKSNFDFQNQRIFFVKTLLKKKSKLKYIYLFSKRKVSLVYAKPHYLEFTKLINFQRGGTLCKQKNFFLQGFTGLPMSNIMLRYKYFDFTTVFDGIHFQESYMFDVLSIFRKNYNFFFFKKIGIKEKSKSFFYFSNVLYSFKDFDFSFYSKSPLKNKSSLYFFKNQIRYVYYLVFFRTVYKKYLLYLNSQFLKLKKYINNFSLNTNRNLLLNRMQLFLQYIVHLKKKMYLYCNILKSTFFLIFRTSKVINNNIKFLPVCNIHSFCTQFNFFNFNRKLKKRTIKCSGNLFKTTKIKNYFNIFFRCYLTMVPFCLNYLNNLNKFMFYLGMLLNIFKKKSQFILENKYFSAVLKRCLFKHKFLSFKWRRKKKNLYKFFFLRRHSIVNNKGFTNFFFKNFLLYNEKHFKKYWKYFFGKKITIWKKLKKKK